MSAKASSSARVRVYVALLRGINVGGKNRLLMADLAEMFARAGCADVRTYIQSGNVVFAAGAAAAGRVPRAVPAMVLERFGFAPSVIVRTGSEVAGVVAGNPFLEEGADPAALHVGFLDGAPSAARIASLDPDRSPGDRFAVKGREMYLHLPNGVARSKLTNAYLDRALATMSTFRNWRTVLKLAEMARA